MPLGKNALFSLLFTVPVGTPYQRGDDLPETTNLPRALQTLFFPACKPLQAVFRVCGCGNTRKHQKAATRRNTCAVGTPFGCVAPLKTGGECRSLLLQFSVVLELSTGGLR